MFTLKTSQVHREDTSDEFRQENFMAQATSGIDRDHADALGRRYLIKFEEDTLTSRPR